MKNVLKKENHEEVDNINNYHYIDNNLMIKLTDENKELKIIIRTSKTNNKNKKIWWKKLNKMNMLKGIK